MGALSPIDLILHTSRYYKAPHWNEFVFMLQNDLPRCPSQRFHRVACAARAEAFANRMTSGRAQIAYEALVALIAMLEDEPAQAA